MRKLISMYLVIAVMAVLVLPFAAAENTVTELIFWTRDGDTFEDEIAAFEAIHPQVKVTRVGMGEDYDALITKYVAASVAGDMPHVGIVSQRYGIPQIYDSGKLHAIEDFMSEEEQQDVLEGYWSRYTYKGKRISVPFQSSMPVLYVNKTLLDAAGLEVPTTWEEVIEAAAKLTKDLNGDGVTDIYGFNLPNDAPWDVNGLAFAAGARMVAEDGSVNVNVPEMIYILEGIQRMCTEGSMPANQHNACSDDFKNGTLAMMLSSCASNRGVAKGVQDKFEYALCTFPSVNGTVAAPIGGNSLGIFKSTPDMEAIAWEFVKYMTSPEAQTGFTLDKGYLPITHSLMETEFVKDRLADTFWNQTFAQIEYLNGQPVHPADATIWNELKDIMSIIEADPNASVADLVAEMQSEVEDFVLDY